jgi:hypothetical protein
VGGRRGEFFSDFLSFTLIALGCGLVLAGTMLFGCDG